ncbi:MAG: polymer-forming cytoskeletal protein [Reichenbachiella sp.]|uniref:polymer-forming cytoskeletal protein n=1 Tax=Reichenbachiella sp. TaxID=2184521 RepID=UPI0032637CB2
MKTIALLIMTCFSTWSFAQSERIIIQNKQQDDTYRAGETIKVNAAIQGDLVVAGGTLTFNDSINGDLTAAGGELFLNGYIEDDVRIAAGRVTIDSEIGDDLVVFGGEVILARDAIVRGNLICFGGNIEINGEVHGKLDVRGGDILIDGTIRETSKIVGDGITIGSNAKFYKELQYWNSEGEIDFEESLINTNAQFNEDLKEEKSESSLTTFGTTSVKLWVFYVLSAFLVILVLHALFRKAFSGAVEGIENNLLKSFGFGLIYLLGIPLLIILALLMIVGIPLGLFATVIFIFSLLFGHLIAALLVVYYFKHKNEKDWGFWSITFLALLCAVLLRLLTIIPLAGILLSVVILSITYGALTLKVLQSQKELITT